MYRFGFGFEINFRAARYTAEAKFYRTAGGLVEINRLAKMQTNARPAFHLVPITPGVNNRITAVAGIDSTWGRRLFAEYFPPGDAL